MVSLTGHRAAVYCCTFDRTGRRLITGADDYNVEHVRTALLGSELIRSLAE